MPIVMIIAKDSIIISGSDNVIAAIKHKIIDLGLPFNSPLSTSIIIDNDGDDHEVLHAVALVSRSQ